MSAVEDKPNTGVLTVISIATVIIATFSAVGVAALAGWAEEREFARKVESRPVPELEALRASQRERLSNYGWVDRESGTAHIPIEEGKRRLLDSLR